MKLSTRARYGSRVMTELAAAYPQGTVSVKELSALVGVSVKYLEQILGTLKGAGLVTAARGAGGGYAIARPPGEMRLSEVVLALEGSLGLVDCVDRPESCLKHGTCPTRDTWLELSHALMRTLEGTTLQDLVERKMRKGRPSASSYNI